MTSSPPLISNHMPTNQLQALDAAHHMHPFSDGAEIKAKGARIITSANGVTLIDSQGNNILDAMAGLWCVNIGYGRKELADISARQMLQLPYYNTFFQTSHVPAIALATKLAELTPPNLNKVFFASSGSEANDTNIRLVRHYWASLGKADKSIIISRHNAYHGSTIGGASLGGMGAMHKQGGLPIADIAFIDEPNWYEQGGELSPEEFGLERANQLQRKIEELGEHKIAAFIAEPIQGAGGVIIPPASYWPQIQKICDAHEILLIVDEVICGFGRTGHWFGSNYFQIKPDIITVAKGLSSGYAPIGASIISEEIAQIIYGAGDFNHGYTYSGHPVCAAVALENLRIIEEENIIGQVHDDTGPYLAAKWGQLADHPLIGEAKIVGMMASVALTPDKASRAPFGAAKGSVGLICREFCFANNLIMRHVGDRMIISPPLIISLDEIDLLIDRALKSFDQTLAHIKAEGLYI